MALQYFQIETTSMSESKPHQIKVPVAVLKAGETRSVQTVLEFPDPPVTFKLVEGNGPVYIHGQVCFMMVHLNGEKNENKIASESFYSSCWLKISLRFRSCQAIMKLKTQPSCRAKKKRFVKKSCVFVLPACVAFHTYFAYLWYCFALLSIAGGRRRRRCQAAEGEKCQKRQEKLINLIPLAETKNQSDCCDNNHNTQTLTYARHIRQHSTVHQQFQPNNQHKLHTHTHLGIWPCKSIINQINLH